MKKPQAHIFTPYQEELDLVRVKFMEMAGLVELQVGDAVKSFEQFDLKLAEAVIEREDFVDRMEVDIEQLCTKIIALRAPTASDLRSMLGTIRSIGELERIGDESSKIAAMMMKLANETLDARVSSEVHYLGKSVMNMLRESIDCYARKNAQAAVEILAQDDEIDSGYASSLRQLVNLMKEDSESISKGIHVLWILRSLERIGDHAKNLCEAVVYIVQAKDIRHGNIAAMAMDG